MKTKSNRQQESEINNKDQNFIDIRRIPLIHKVEEKLLEIPQQTANQRELFSGEHSTSATISVFFILIPDICLFLLFASFTFVSSD